MKFADSPRVVYDHTPCRSSSYTTHMVCALSSGNYSAGGTFDLYGFCGRNTVAFPLYTILSSLPPPSTPTDPGEGFTKDPESQTAMLGDRVSFMCAYNGGRRTWVWEVYPVTGNRFTIRDNFSFP